MAESRCVFQEAVDHALAGDWRRAHELVQEHEGEQIADWIHGVVHWMEGDMGNARYWLRRAGRKEGEHPTPEAALRAIKAAVDR